MGLSEQGKVTIEVKGKDSTGGAFKGALGSVTSLGKNLAKATVAGAAVATVAVVGFAAKAGQAFIGFEDSMNEVFTLLPDISEQAMGAMREDVLAASKEMGRLPDEIIPALYQSLSAGVPQGNVFEFLDQAHKTALAGVTDIETAVDALTSVTNAYGLDVISTEQASDILFTTVKKGKTTMDELGASISKVTPGASSMGISFGSVTASLATLTSTGIKTKVAATQMKAVFTELGKSGSEVDKVFREVAGEGFTQFIEGGGTLQEGLEMLKVAAEDSNLTIKDLFGSVEAGDAALILTGSGAETFADNLDAMADSAGATDEAYDRMNSGIARTVEVLQAQFVTTLISVGDALAPLISMIGEKLVGVMDQAGEVIGILTTNFGYLMEVWASGDDVWYGTAEIFGNIAEKLGATDAVVRQIMDSFLFLGEVVTALGSAWTAFQGYLSNGYSILMALQAAMAMFMAQMGVSSEVMQQVMQSFNAFVLVVQQVIAVVMSAISPIIQWFQANAQLSDVLATLGILIAAVLIPIIVSLITTIVSILAPIALVFAAVVLLREAWENNWGGIQEKTKWVIDTIGPIFETIVEWLSVNIPVAIEFLVAVYHEILVPMWNDIKHFVLDIVVPAFVTLVEWLKVNIPAGIETVVSKFLAFKQALEDVKAKIASFVSWATAKWNSFVDKIKMPEIFQQASPSPFEQSIMDINTQFRELIGYTGAGTRVQLYALSSAFPQALSNENGSTTQGVNNTRYRNNVYNLNVATQENAYRVINEFNIAAAYGGR